MRPIDSCLIIKLYYIYSYVVWIIVWKHLLDDGSEFILNVKFLDIIIIINGNQILNKCEFDWKINHIWNFLIVKTFILKNIGMSNFSATFQVFLQQ